MPVSISVRHPYGQTESANVGYEQEMSAARALELAQTAPGSQIRSVDLEDFGGRGGRMVTAINGRWQNERSDEYWFLYVNGEYMKSTGIDDTLLDDGDQVEFRYEVYQG